MQFTLNVSKTGGNDGTLGMLQLHISQIRVTPKSQKMPPYNRLEER